MASEDLHGIKTEVVVVAVIMRLFQTTYSHLSLLVGIIVTMDSITSFFVLFVVPSTEATWDDETNFTGNQNDGIYLVLFI